MNEVYACLLMVVVVTVYTHGMMVEMVTFSLWIEMNGMDIHPDSVYLLKISQ